MAQIEQRLLDGRLKAGDQLPSERELSTLLGVSRPSLRESLRVLESLGIVDIRRGGSDGGARLVDSPGAGLVNLLKLQLALGHFSQQDVLETRLALEVWSIAEAADRRGDDDLDDLEAILDRMDDEQVSAAEFNGLDAAFHVRIAESSGNALSAHLMGSLRLAIHRQMVERYARLADWRETAKTVRAEHRALLDAIRTGDATTAVARMRAHILDFYSNSNSDTDADRPRDSPPR